MLLLSDVVDAAAAAVPRLLPNICWYALPCCGPNVLNLGGCTCRPSAADRLSSCISAEPVSALVRRGGGGGARFLPRPSVLSACTGLFSALFERMYALTPLLAESSMSADATRRRLDGCSLTSSEL